MGSSDDFGWYEIVVNFGATVFATEPNGQIADAISYFDESLCEGTLTGVGSTATSAKGQIGLVPEYARKCRRPDCKQLYCRGLLQLADAYKKTDGNPNPADFVTGNAATQLASQIQSLMTSLGCQ